jgi:hypothetical protein
VGEVIPTVGDQRSRDLAERLRRAAGEVKGPQFLNVVNALRNRVFISHTSVDDEFIKGTKNGLEIPGSILRVIHDAFPDPFYHSLKTGGADMYIRIVGLALLAFTRVVFVWSANALRSDFVRAEILIAAAGRRRLGVYMMPGAPRFPVEGPELVYDCEALGAMMDRWRDTGEYQLLR